MGITPVGTAQIPRLGAIEDLPIETLKLYSKNARTHSAAQIEDLIASFKKFGWTNPVLVREDMTIIAGHGRVTAARQMGATFAPCIVAKGWTEAQCRAYTLADNKLALAAGWDEALLSLELGELKALDETMIPFTGFSAREIAELNAVDEPKAEIGPHVAALLNTAWAELLAEYVQVIDGAGLFAISPNLTPATAAVNFIHAKYLGKEFAQSNTLAFCPQRLTTAGDVFSLRDGLKNAAEDPRIIEGYRWLCQEKPGFDHMIRLSGMPVRRAKMPLDFPATLARDLMQEFHATKVLDPCHGWGGRYVGFLLAGSTVEQYVGFDPSPDAHKGLKLAAKTLARFSDTTKDAKFIELPFEDAGELTGFDFALTSPPYFDAEKYAGEKSSRVRWPEFDQWRDGFYLPMMAKVAEALVAKAVFVLQVGSQRYPLAQIAIDAAKSVGFEFVERRDGIMPNNQGETSDDRGETALIFRRIARAKRKAKASNRDAAHASS